MLRGLADAGPLFLCKKGEEPYKNIEAVDRIGSGDTYVSGVLYGPQMEMNR